MPCRKLLVKIEKEGIRRTVIRWVRTLLRQTTTGSVEKGSKRVKETATGCSPGLVLGTIFFNMFIKNHVIENLSKLTRFENSTK